MNTSSPSLALRFLLVLLVLTSVAGAADAPASPPAHASESAHPPAPAPAPAISPAKAERLLAEDKNLVALDVRTPEEFARGHLRGAKNIDARGTNFQALLRKLDGSKTYLVHCARGLDRTTKACELLKSYGITNVVRLDGGLNAWEKDGKPLEK